MTRIRHPRRMRGFSMIEVLIALLVLAFGLLGLALLQTMNLRYTQSSNYRTQATNLANDLLEQMRANRIAAAQYRNAAFTANSISPSGCRNGTYPTGAVSVAQSITRWQCAVVETLGPGASATVTYDDGETTVTLSWGERVRGSSSTTLPVTTRL